MKTSTSWPPSAEEEDGAELRVNGGTKDDLVAVELGHRLDGDTLEVLRAGLFRNGRTECARKASRTASSSLRFSWTPPTSVLWVMVSE